MARRTLRYETDDGEERFAVWSTVVDDWIEVGLTAEERIEMHVDEEARKARERMTKRIEDLRNGEARYAAWDPDEMRERLREGIDDA